MVGRSEMVLAGEREGEPPSGGLGCEMAGRGKAVCSVDRYVCPPGDGGHVIVRLWSNGGEKT